MDSPQPFPTQVGWSLLGEESEEDLEEAHVPMCSCQGVVVVCATGM